MNSTYRRKGPYTTISLIIFIVIGAIYGLGKFVVNRDPEYQKAVQEKYKEEVMKDLYRKRQAVYNKDGVDTIHIIKFSPDGKYYQTFKSIKNPRGKTERGTYEFAGFDEETQSFELKMDAYGFEETRKFKYGMHNLELIMDYGSPDKKTFMIVPDDKPRRRY